MHWFILAVIALALLLVAGRFPKTAFALMLGLVAVFVLLFRYSNIDRTGSGSLVTPADVILSHVRMEPGYADSYKFSGRLLSHAKRGTLNEVSVRIVLEDCDDDSADRCVMIGEVLDRIPVSVPPGQARDFTRNVYLGRTKPQGLPRWSHEVVAVTARD